MRRIKCSAAALGLVFLTGCAGGAAQSNEISGTIENIALNFNMSVSALNEEIAVFRLSPSDTESDPDAPSYDSGYDNEVCYNVTPADITEKYGMTIYKFDKSCCSVLHYDGEYHMLGEFFGGFGTTSFAVADLNGDGCEELYFTFSWGSGLHRSQAGYFDTSDKTERIYGYGNHNSDMVLTAEDNRLLVYDADIELNSFVDIELTPTEKIGELVFNGTETLFCADEADESFSPVIFSLTD